MKKRDYTGNSPIMRGLCGKVSDDGSMSVETFKDPCLGVSWGELGARVLTSGNRVSVTLGYPAQGAETDYARELGAAMIVMSTHGRSGLRHLLIGSTAEGVVRHATCPVLTVRGSTAD